MDDNQETTAANDAAPKKSNTLVIIGALVIIVVLAFATWEFALKGDSASATPTPVAENITSAPTQTSQAQYKDGSYEATGKYQNPQSVEDLDVKITLKDGVVTAADFTGTPDNPTTKLMHDKFREGYKAEVVGKSIDEISLGVVNGSSLTPKGFMDALEKIKTEAQS